MEDIDSGRLTLIYNLGDSIDDHHGLSMVIQSLIYEKGWLFIQNPQLDEGHWLYQSKAINLDNATLVLSDETKVSGYFSGYYVFGDVHIVDQLILRINDQPFVITNPSIATMTNATSGVHTLYLGQSNHVGTALGQASDYEDEYGSFLEGDFERDINLLHNLRAQLLGEAASVSIQKAAYNAELHLAPNCQNSVSVISINDQKNIQCDSLEKILQTFMKHQKLTVNMNIISSFISEVVLVSDTQVQDRNGSSTNLDFESFIKEYQPLANPNPDTCLCDVDGVSRGFAIYGDDLAVVQAANPNCVWTVISQNNDAGNAIVNGKHFVNRIFYVITKKPWSDGEFLSINTPIY
ncbi:hypothetical protein QN395_19430 [Undibacterium sp. RTI2.2]|nr:hypothetical protein [Undibacterium sp. RTI2.2]